MNRPVCLKKRHVLGRFNFLVVFLMLGMVLGGYASAMGAGANSD